MLHISKPVAGATATVTTGTVPATNINGNVSYDARKQLSQDTEVSETLEFLRLKGLIVPIGGQDFTAPLRTNPARNAPGQSGMGAASVYKFSSANKQTTDAVCNLLAKFDDISSRGVAAGWTLF